MDSIPKYIANRHCPHKIKYLHPKIRTYFKSYIWLYSIPRASNADFMELAGYDYGRSDEIRRAMSKKKVDVMNKEREYFVSGCMKNGVNKQSKRKFKK